MTDAPLAPPNPALPMYSTERIPRERMVAEYGFVEMIPVPFVPLLAPLRWWGWWR